MKVRYMLAFLTVVAALSASKAAAQSWGPWMPVTDKCGCSAPTDVDPRCVATITSCERRDSAPVITNAGTAGTTYGAIGSCIDCPACCQDSTCPPYTVSCAITSSVTFTRSRTLSIGGKIVYKTVVEAELNGSVGWTTGMATTITSTCTVSGLKCGRVFQQAWISFITGRQAIMYHEWQLTGTWGGAGCPIPPPGTWTKACGTGSSKITVDIDTNMGCNTLCADKCAPGDCDAYAP